MGDVTRGCDLAALMGGRSTRREFLQRSVTLGGTLVFLNGISPAGVVRADGGPLIEASSLLLSAPSGENLILNPGFEDGETSPDHWRFIDANTGGTWLWDTKEKYDGQRSVKLILNTSTDRAIIDQRYISVKGGTFYRFSTFAKTDQLTGAPFIKIYWYDSARQLTGTPVNIEFSNELDQWTRISRDIVAPENAALALLQMQVWRGTGYLWYDRVEWVEYVPEAGITPRSDTFNATPTAQADIPILLITQGSTLNGLRIDETYLQESHDYTVSGKIVTLHKSFLASLPLGTTEITFDLSSGRDPIFTVEVIDVPVTSDNLITNPGFEDGSKQPANWTFDGDRFGKWKWDRKSAYEGSRSLLLSANPNADAVSAIQPYIAVQEGATYQLEAYYRTDKMEGRPAIRLEWFSRRESKGKIGEASTTGLSDAADWSQLYYEQVAPRGAKYASVSLQVVGGMGDAWFDRVVLKQHNLLLNPDFEQGGKLPYYWSFDRTGAGAEVVWEGSGSDRSVRLITREPDDAAALVRANAPVHSGKPYHLQFRYRTDSVPVVRWSWHDVAGELVGMVNDRPGPATDMTEYATSQSAPSRAAYLTLRVGLDQGPGSLQLDRFELRQTLLSADGELIPVTDIADVNEPVDPDEFWSRIPAAQLNPPESSVWTVEVLRSYFFGLTQNAETSMTLDTPERVLQRDEQVPTRSGLLGKPVDPEMPLAIASDIDFSPFVKGHGGYSKRYYPRRMHDYLLQDYQPAYVLTGNPYFRERAEQLIRYLDFSQWKADGSNAFASKFYPGEYAAHPEWRGGWDYLFDWEWRDAYGYTWNLHEPDHHVNSQIALSLVYAYEILQHNSRYIDMAREFVHHQIPRYGFHEGVWNNHTYYWTEYNPSGESEGNPATDATDNVVALVASAVAVVGYYEPQPELRARYLEFASGLIWYLVREYASDGRFYYDGAENPLNPRKVISHDRAVLLPAYIAMVYLYKAGVDIDHLLQGFADVEEEYYRMWPVLQGMSYLKVFKLYDGAPFAGNTLTFTTFVQPTTESLSQARFSDTIPEGFETPESLQLRISEVLPPDAKNPNWTINRDHDVVYTIIPSRLQQGVIVPFEMGKHGTYIFSYQLTTKPDFDQKAADDTDSALFGWAADDEGRATFIHATSGNAIDVEHAFTMPLRLDMKLNATNFLSRSAALLFPFEQETSAELIPSKPHKAVPYADSNAWGRVSANEYIYPIQSLMPIKSSSGEPFGHDVYAEKGRLYRATKPGDYVEVEFEVYEPDAEYHVLSGFATGRDRGKVAILIDGVQQGGEFDQYANTRYPTLEIVDQGTRVLARGTHTLVFKVTGKNPASSGYAIGIYDAIVLRPVTK